MTPTREQDGDGDGGSAQLLSGGVGQQQVTVRFQRHTGLANLPTVRFQLIVYGLDL